ncbi:adenosine deaminase-like protein isoform X2 [Prorops nasuta]|uniref:adenosine deaminase-like protein isoform X2 n=1 Tax=Prorops nasuta TaxID=863751 RepID=UPI0034CED85B
MRMYYCRCFQTFAAIQKLTITSESLYLATCEVIREFSEDNVIYLELRSTPRKVEGLLTKVEYIEAIILAIKECAKKYPTILVKLLISVDRKQGCQNAEENIDLAIKFMKKYPSYIVGIDLSGEPTMGDAFLHLLETSREAGLKIAAHCAEVPNEEEIMRILNFKPDRLGHCTCVHPNLKGSEKLFNELLKSKIPVELCLTSNVKCETVPSYALHQFKYYYEAGHPICIATDDKGVFDTTLSAEFEIICNQFGCEKHDLIKLSKSAVSYSFASEEEKVKLLSIIEQHQ